MDNDEEKWGESFLGCDIISPAQFQRINSECGNVVVQIASGRETDISKQLLQMGISDYVLYSELHLLPRLEKYLTFESNPEFYKYYLENIYKPLYIGGHLWDYYLSSNKNWNSTVICCMPPKTGNHTVFYGGERYCPSDVLYVDA